MNKKKTKASIHSQKQEKPQSKGKKILLIQNTKPIVTESTTSTNFIPLHNSFHPKKNKKAEYSSKTHKSSTKRVQGRLQGKAKGMSLDLGERRNKQNRSTNRHVNGTEKGKILKQALPSFRQYCIIEGQFIHLQLSEERKIYQTFEETACTSQDNSGVFNKQSSSLQRKKRAINVEEVVAAFQPAKVQTSSIGVETLFQKQIKYYEILVKAAQQEFGTQYSDRKIQLSDRKEGCELQNKISFLKNKKIETLTEKNEKYQEQLQVEDNQKQFYEALMKIQRIKNPDVKTLQKLSKQQKKHFRQVFQTLLVRLHSPRIEPGTRFDNNSDINSLKGIQTISKSCSENSNIEQLIFAREAKQLSEIPTYLHHEKEIDSSLLAVLNTYSDFFCYMQLHHQDTLVKAINRMYGWSYMDKYRFISKVSKSSEVTGDPILHIIQEIRKRQSGFNIINEAVFLDFMEEIIDPPNTDANQSEQEDQKPDQSLYTLFHSKCLFDCINELLRHYQPFFYTKGDLFPWSLQVLKCMTFYSIDEESLGTVISQVQQKLANEILNSLCGLHIDNYKPNIDYKQLSPPSHLALQDMVYRTRIERQNKMIQEWVQKQDESSDVQLEVTYLLLELSNGFIQSLLDEAEKEFKGIFSRKISMNEK